MIKIKIVCVGGLKEDYWKNATKEYTKRLSRFCELTVCELPEKNKENAKLTLQAEKEGILKQLEGFVVVLDKNGEMFDSEQLSKKIENIALSGKDKITFVIGSSYGLDDEVKARANLLLSYSKMTFPHQLARVMLLEQIYRAFTILSNITYHK